MRSFLCNHLNRLEAFVDIDLLLFEIFAISGVGVEFVALRVFDFLLLLLRMGISTFLHEVRPVGGAGTEWLKVRVELVIFDEDFLFFNAFRAVLIAVL